MKAVFIDLEKAYDRGPREAIRRCARVRNVQETYLALIQAMYWGSETKVRSVAGQSNNVGVKVGLLQGPV